jgi:hypothetical protein
MKFWQKLFAQPVRWNERTTDMDMKEAYRKGVGRISTWREIKSVSVGTVSGDALNNVIDEFIVLNAPGGLSDVGFKVLLNSSCQQILQSYLDHGKEFAIR